MRRRRALTALTLVAALASFIFLPLTQALIDAHGWRDALVILAVHPRRGHRAPARAGPARPGPHPCTRCRAGDLRRPPARRCGHAAFWLLSAAFFLATLTGIAMTVQAIPFLLERGYTHRLRRVRRRPHRHLADPGSCCSSLPWPHGCRGPMPPPACSRSWRCGIAFIVGVHATAAVLAGFVLLGMGNGMTTLARATAMADLYGQRAYGTIAQRRRLAHHLGAGRGTGRGRAMGGSLRLSEPCCGRWPLWPLPPCRWPIALDMIHAIPATGFTAATRRTARLNVVGLASARL